MAVSTYSYLMKDREKKDFTTRIHNALQSIRPYLQADGGDIEFIDLDNEMNVEVMLTGACHGCPMSIQTMKFGVEQTLKAAIPQIKAVKAINHD